MIFEVGAYLLTLALGVTAWSVVTAGLGSYSRSASLQESAERGVLITSVLLGVSSLILIYALVGSHFQVRYVADYTSRDLPLFYKLTGFWGGQSGSLLLWTLILSGLSSVAVLKYRDRLRDLMPGLVLVLSAIMVFFLILLNFAAKPFELLAFLPADGRGLNPQLQNPFMVIHPPLLYLGFVGFSVPFAFAMAALIGGRTDNTWLRATRRWTLFAWFFLSIGILLGAYWAYIELGWGGYWAWDPVENASFIPWLTGTAFLHSVMIQEKKGMLRVWNMVLVLLTFFLCILGTFLTRSGVISSVHAFARSDVAPLFVGFLSVVAVASTALILYRLPMLRSTTQIESIISREGAFLVNNVLLVVSAFAVLWATLFPILSEWVRGVKITVSSPFYNQIMTPLGLLLLLATGAGPLIAWRKASPKQLRSQFMGPTLTGLITTGALIFAGVRHTGALISLGLCAFVLAAVFSEFYRGTQARVRSMGERPLPALIALVDRNKRRYGGYLVHVAIVMIFVGITGSSVFQSEAQASLKRGESMQLGPYELEYTDTSSHATPNVEVFAAHVRVRRNGQDVGVLAPERNFYIHWDQPSSEVGLLSTLREDLYVILVGHDPRTDTATFKVYLNPLVNWIWLGGLMLIIGTHIAVLPDRRERTAHELSGLLREQLIPARG
ncbi:MAG: heme lyase CcmF/NrfE family subunit [Acidobacteria bacterium]|nr:heme lyase CcmF/NrfE family subunit [Acidobacteriota bacterium]